MVMLISCENQTQKGERLAKQYCSSCHLYTEPGLLNKKTWEKNVLPQMAFRMGFSNMEIMSAFTEEDMNVILTSLPPRPMVSQQEWDAIQRFYLTQAPDSIAPPAHLKKKTLQQFDVTAMVYPAINSLVTLIKSDTIEKKIWIGTRHSKLFQLNNKLEVEDSIRLNSPPSYIQFGKDTKHIVTAMGIMDPNDQSRGSLQQLSLTNHSAVPFIDSLQRPVFFEKADLNNDGQADYVVCAFGNFTGSLTAFESTGNGQFKKHTLFNQPGARKVIVQDINKDGLKDIIVLMSQGDEQISLLTNAGNFNFRITGLLRFPPIYGSSYFDIADFNHDGAFDILYTNGDNADYSIVLKSYHGVHVFLNNGKNSFTESWSYPMHGASQALARDFDADGDLDIAAIAFFPDFNYPEEGFIYFENTGSEYTAYITPAANAGRWLVMDATDIDEDGDEDILLGALNFNNGVPPGVVENWKAKKTSVLIARNQLY